MALRNNFRIAFTVTCQYIPVVVMEQFLVFSPATNNPAEWRTLSGHHAGFPFHPRVFGFLSDSAVRLERASLASALPNRCFAPSFINAGDYPIGVEALPAQQGAHRADILGCIGLVYDQALILGGETTPMRSGGPF
jgi:hypothetical protein